MTYTLFASKGWGSVITEAMLEIAKVPYVLEESENWTEGASRKKLLKINPLAQLPTLLLPDGAVMTESAAIALLLGDRFPKSQLAPPVDHPDRARFLRWLLFLVAALYPTFTYGDDPSRWVENEAGGKQLRATTDEHRKTLWKVIEADLGNGPHWLGKSFSALDVYAAVMGRWRPRAEWFAEETPKLHAISLNAMKQPDFANVMARNFPV